MLALSLPFVVGLYQGLLHGLGPDHCAAMATLSTANPTRRATLQMAVRFALGHMTVLASLAALCLFAGVELSKSFESWAELGGGVVLVVLAAAAFFFPSSLVHGHPHLPGHAQSHRHATAPSKRTATAAGALMAVSGVRALVLALPPLVVGGGFSLRGLTYLPGFALGILTSMGAMGLVLTAGLSQLRSEVVLRRLQRGVALASGALGLFWIGAELFHR